MLQEDIFSKCYEILSVTIAHFSIKLLNIAGLILKYPSMLKGNISRYMYLFRKWKIKWLCLLKTIHRNVKNKGKLLVDKNNNRSFLFILTLVKFQFSSPLLGAPHALSVHWHKMAFGIFSIFFGVCLQAVKISKKGYLNFHCSNRYCQISI